MFVKSYNPERGPAAPGACRLLGLLLAHSPCEAPGWDVSHSPDSWERTWQAVIYTPPTPILQHSLPVAPPFLQGAQGSAEDSPYPNSILVATLQVGKATNSQPTVDIQGSLHLSSDRNVTCFAIKNPPMAAGLFWEAGNFEELGQLPRRLWLTVLLHLILFGIKSNTSGGPVLFQTLFSLSFLSLTFTFRKEGSTEVGEFLRDCSLCAPHKAIPTKKTAPLKRTASPM